jgi:hypothetical protein
MNEYRQQLAKGTLQVAYKGLMEYLMALRTHFQNHYPHYSVPGGIYYGYMDMSYFSIRPQSLKDRQLKIAIVFLHREFRFEVWLAAVNKGVQRRYWSLFQERGWNRGGLVPTPQGADAILASILIADPDFGDLDALTGQIEAGTLQFIAEVDAFLSRDQ